MSTWFTSDTHYGHANIIDYCARPFASAEEMDEDMISLWNAVVRPGDDVYHLGDFAMGPDLARRVAAIRRRLAGRIVLVLGNHDRSAAFYRRAGFDHVTSSDYTLTTPAGLVWMRHHPPERALVEHDAYRLLLCGHVHEKWKQKGKLINVGVDQWGYAPVHLDTLLALTEATP